MPIRATATSFVRAPCAVVYGIIADYRNGHPRILPERYFGPLTVEEGGTGAGTRIRFTIRTPGMQHDVRAQVEEPVPGRVLLERVPATDTLTTFTVTPSEGGCTVTIDTSWPVRGVRGIVEWLFAPAFLRKVYRAELQMLRQVAEPPGT